MICSEELYHILIRIAKILIYHIIGRHHDILSPHLIREIMPITGTQIIILSVYIASFICIVIFFEMRLDHIHRRHIEKLWPVGEDGLKIIDRKLKIIVRIIFLILLVLSVAIILTLL